jgi:hypothetical protein
VRRVAVLTLLLGALSPTPAFAAPCSPGESGPRFTTRVETNFKPYTGPERQWVRVCDRRTGDEQVLARTRDSNRLAFTSAGAAGTRVTWMEVRRRGIPATAVIVSRDLRTGRRTARVVGRVRGKSDVMPQLAVAPTGAIAYAVWTRTRALRVVARGRTVTPYANPGPIAWEDGDRTLRWGDGLRQAYADLRSPRQQDGCPTRERFRIVLDSAGVRVTRAVYAWPRDDEDGITTMLRVCRVGSGRDAVLASAFKQLDGDAVTVVGVDQGTVTVRRQGGSRYTGCVINRTETYAVDTGRWLNTGPNEPCR